MGIVSGQHATPEQLAFMIRNGTGIVCAPMTSSRAETLQLPRMVQNNQDPKSTAFTVSCDSKMTSTGVSATDRATTIRQLASKDATSEDFNRPGHIFPLIARPGGVRERPGHTEAAVDLCLLSGVEPV